MVLSLAWSFCFCAGSLIIIIIIIVIGTVSQQECINKVKIFRRDVKTKIVGCVYPSQCKQSRHIQQHDWIYEEDCAGCFFALREQEKFWKCSWKSIVLEESAAVASCPLHNLTNVTHLVHGKMFCQNTYNAICSSMTERKWFWAVGRRKCVVS